MIEVVGGLIVRGDRVLLTQRVPDKKSYPFAWESPGGKVEDGESHHAALRRELMEEIDIDVGPLPENPIFQHEFQYGRAATVIWFLYRVPIISGTPTPREGQGIGWFTSEELTTLQMTPGNTAAANMITWILASATR